MVAGDAPFHAEDPIALVVMNMQQPLPDLRTRPLGVPEELVKLIERMGEKDPANRPQSCDEVVRLLDEIMGNTDSLSGQQGVVVTGGQVPPTNTYATADEPPRGRALAIGLGAFLAVVGVGIAVLVFTGSKHADPPLVVSVDRPAPPVDEHRIQNTANDPLARPPAAQALKDSPPPEKVGTKPLRVAVLKFQNLSKDPALDGMSLGIGETAASSMVGVAKGRMQLIERGDIESDIGEIDRGKDEHFDKSTTALAGKLNGVEIAVQGGFQRVGRTMRITARFVRVETGEIIDTLHVDGRVRKTFDMQDDVANALRGKLVALVDKERPPADKP